MRQPASSPRPPRPRATPLRRGPRSPRQRPRAGTSLGPAGAQTNGIPPAAGRDRARRFGRGVLLQAVGFWLLPSFHVHRVFGSPQGAGAGVSQTERAVQPEEGNNGAAVWQNASGVLQEQEKRPPCGLGRVQNCWGKMTDLTLSTTEGVNARTSRPTQPFGQA